MTCRYRAFFRYNLSTNPVIYLFLLPLRPTESDNAFSFKFAATRKNVVWLLEIAFAGWQINLNPRVAVVLSHGQRNLRNSTNYQSNRRRLYEQYTDCLRKTCLARENVRYHRKYETLKIIQNNLRITHAMRPDSTSEVLEPGSDRAKPPVFSGERCKGIK